MTTLEWVEGELRKAERDIVTTRATPYVSAMTLSEMRARIKALTEVRDKLAGEVDRSMLVCVLCKDAFCECADPD